MNPTKKIISTAVSVGTTFSLGMLSLGGMMLVVSSLWWAVPSFFLAVIIEGTVYHRNIEEAIKRFGDQKKYLRLAIAQRALRKLRDLEDHPHHEEAHDDEHDKDEHDEGHEHESHEHDDEPDAHHSHDHAGHQTHALKKYRKNFFLKYYFAQKKYLHELEEDLNNFTDTSLAELEIARVKHRLEQMELLLLDCIEHNQAKLKNVPPRLVNEIKTMLPDCINAKELTTEVDNKHKYMNYSIAVAVGAGTCAGLVTMANLQSSFLVIGICLGASSLLPIVGFAAVGYALMMYRTITDMIQNDTLQKWAKQIRYFWHNKQKNWKDYLKMAGIALIVGIAITATIATAGTWWYLAKAGATYLPKIAAAIISTASWACMIVPNLLFNLVNSFKSIKKLPSIWHSFTDNVGKQLNSLKNENVLQWINPLRIIYKLFTLSVFVGHLVSMAVTEDRCPHMSPTVATVVNSANEAAVDADYIAHGHHHEENDAHAHDATGPHHEANNTHSHCDGHGGTNLSNSHHPHHANHMHDAKNHDHPHSASNDDDDDDAHDHGSFILDKIETALKWCSVAWDYVAVLAVDYLLRQTSTHTWQASKDQFFEKRDLPPAPQPEAQWADDWLRYETQFTLEEQSQKYQEKGVPKKASAFQTLQTACLGQAKDADGEKPAVPIATIKQTLNAAIEEGQLLAKRRYPNCGLFATTPPDSKQAITQLLNDRSLTGTWQLSS